MALPEVVERRLGFVELPEESEREEEEVKSQATSSFIVYLVNHSTGSLCLLQLILRFFYLFLKLYIVDFGVILISDHPQLGF